MGSSYPELPKTLVKAMFLTSEKVDVNASVAFLLASITTCHTFKIEVYHRFPLALGVTFCLAIASDCKFFHITPKFYVYLTTAPGGNKLNNIISQSPLLCPDGDIAHDFDYKDTKRKREKRIFSPVFIRILAQKS